MSTSPATTLYDRIEVALNLGEPNSVIREIRVALENLFKQLTRLENRTFNEYLNDINGLKIVVVDRIGIRILNPLNFSV